MASTHEHSAARDLCWNCQSAPGGEFFCESCVKIQPVSRETDYFSYFGLPRRLGIDPKALEKRFYELSRKLHPDYFQQKTEEEKAISLENAAVLNAAYRTLRDPIQRAGYLIRLEEGSAKSIPSKPPADLFEEILEIQESLEDFGSLKKSDPTRSAPLRNRLEEVKGRLAARKEALGDDLFQIFKRWDVIGEGGAAENRKAVLEEMKAILAQGAYLETVLQDLAEALG